jgi:arginyl-tRNA synthetase
MDFKQEIAALIAGSIREQFGQSIEGVADFMETPPAPALGDYAFPCFKLAKSLRKAPNLHSAGQLAGSLHAPLA